MNLTINSIADSQIANANVNIAQRNNIFRSISVQELFISIYEDYKSVYMAVVDALHSAGHNVWCYATDNSEEAIYQNILSGAIPKDKEPDAVLQLISINPFDERYTKMLNLIPDSYQDKGRLISFLLA